MGITKIRASFNLFTSLCLDQSLLSCGLGSLRLAKLSLIALVVGLALFGVSSVQAGILKVGASPLPQAQILEFIKPKLAEQGVQLEIVEFNDYIQPNIAMMEKNLDASIHQTYPLLNFFNDDRETNLVAMADLYISPMGLYSKSVSSLDDLSEGATVAFSNQIAIGGRSLLLLQQQGLIELRDPSYPLSNRSDVISNPYHLKFSIYDTDLLPTVLPDVDLAAISTSNALAAGLNPVKDSLARESDDTNYIMVLTTRPDLVDSLDIQLLTQALTSPETKKFIGSLYDGALIPVTGNSHEYPVIPHSLEYSENRNENYHGYGKIPGVTTQDGYY